MDPITREKSESEESIMETSKMDDVYGSRGFEVEGIQLYAEFMPPPLVVHKQLATLLIV